MNNEFTIERAQNTLDRIVGFVGNCDQKAGMMLAASGLFIAFFAQENIIGAILSNCEKIDEFCKCLGVVYKFGLLFSVGLFLYGEYWLVCALRANIDNVTKVKSMVFFGDIRTYTFDCYHEKIKNVTRDELLNDYIAQIYVNALICTAKFERYGQGFSALVRGCVVFLSFFILGFLVRGGNNV